MSGTEAAQCLEAIRAILGHFRRGQSRAEKILRFHPMDYQTLAMLRERPGLTLTELAMHMQLPLTTMASLLARLSDKKLLLRKADPKDRRKSLIRLSRKGENLADIIYAEDISNCAQILQALPEGETQQFLAHLGQIKIALKPSGPD